MNYNPDQRGLRQNQKKKKKKKKKKKLTKAEKAAKAKAKILKRLKVIQSDPDAFIDAYTMEIAKNNPDNPKVYKELLKWKELKDKQNTGSDDDDDDFDMEMFKTNATKSVKPNAPEEKEEIH